MPVKKKTGRNRGGNLGNLADFFHSKKERGNLAVEGVSINSKLGGNTRVVG